MNSLGNKSKSQQTMALKASVPLLSYKAEIIWDPQPPYSDEQNEYRQQQIARAKKTAALLENMRASQQDRTAAAASVPEGADQRAQQGRITLLPRLSGSAQPQTQPPFVDLERDNYIQDIARRKLYYNTLKAENGTSDYMQELQAISKAPPKKKTRRHKTKFRIVKSNKNIRIMKDVLVDYINDNRKFVNTEIISIPAYEKNAPFLPSTVQFADQLIEDKEHLKETYGFDEKNLRKNNCILEQVVLTRLDKKLQNREKSRAKKKSAEEQQQLDGAAAANEERQKLLKRAERKPPAAPQTILQEAQKL